MPPKRRSNLSRVSKEARRARARRAVKYKKYQKMPWKSAKIRALRKRERRAEETQGEAQARREADAARKRRSRAANDSKTLSRREADAARKRRLRAAKDDSKTLSRREADAARKRRSRAAEDKTRTVLWRESDAANHRRARSMETTDKRHAIQAKLQRMQIKQTTDLEQGTEEQCDHIIEEDIHNGRQHCRWETFWQHQSRLEEMHIRSRSLPGSGCFEESGTCHSLHTLGIEEEGKEKELHPLESESPLIKLEDSSSSSCEQSEILPSSQALSSNFIIDSKDAPGTIMQDTELTSQRAKELHKLEHESPMIKAERLSFSNCEKSKDLPPSPSPSSVFNVESQDASCIFTQDIKDITSDGVKELHEVKIENPISKFENLCLSSYEELKESVSLPSQNSAFINNSCSRLSTEAEISQDCSAVVKEEFESWHEECIEDCSNQFESVLKKAQLNKQINAKEKDGEVVDYNIIEKYVETLESLFPVMSRKEIIAALKEVDWNFGLATKNIDDHFKKLKAEKLKEERRRRQQELEIAKKRRLEEKEKERLLKEEQRRSEKEMAVAQLRALSGLEPNSSTLTERKKQFTKRRKLEEKGEKSQGEEGKQMSDKEKALAQLKELEFSTRKRKKHLEDIKVLVTTTETKDVNERHSTKSDKGNIKKISTCQSLRSFRMKRGLQEGTVGHNNLKPFPVVYITEEIGDGGSDQ